MKGLAYSLIKKSQLRNLRKDVSAKEATISSATEFVKQIGKGNLDAVYHSHEEHTDTLATSLVDMRDQMKKFASEEKQRNWATEGLASFVEILRSKGNSFADLSDSIIRHLVKYMNVSQGALYLMNDDDHQDTFLEMVACFAYNRKKHLNQRINLGEGIIGQVVLEKSTTYMKDIPKDYLKITSGLGEALPRNLLIVPLKLNDTVFGVVELASFETILPYRIQFVEKLGESIASTISAVKVSERTQRLLQETQQQTEEMKSQEEEMRQNMEELSATQEEMHRVLTEVQTKEGYLNELINASEDLIYTVDKEYGLLSWNKSFAKTLEQFNMTLEKGSNTLDWYTGDERLKQKDLYDRAFSGQTFELTTQADNQGSIIYFINTYAPLRTAQGEVFSVGVFGKNITEMVTARNQTELLLQQSKNQELYYNDVIEGMSDCVLTIDKDYKIVVANTAFKKVFSRYGLNVEPGADLLAMTQGDKKKEEEFKKPYIKAFAGEHVEEPHRHHFDIDFQVSYSPLRDIDGNVIGVSLIAHDITQRLQLQNQTENLLHEAKLQSEELKAQQEEIHQNMEELSATQDEMQRVLSLVQNKEAYLNTVINAYTDTILTVDKELKITLFNTFLADTFAAQGLSITLGMDVLKLSHPDAVEESIENYRRAFAGEKVVQNQEYFGRYYEITTQPLTDAEGNVIGAGVFTKDITSSTLLLHESQQRLEEVRSQEEELRQNMEEMQAIQEELARKGDELERVRQLERERAETQINAQKKIMNTVMEKFKSSEEQYKARIAILEEKLKEVA